MFLSVLPVCENPPTFEYAVLQPGLITLGANRTYILHCPFGMIKYGTPKTTCGPNSKWSPIDIGCRGKLILLDLKIKYMKPSPKCGFEEPQFLLEP